MPALLNELISIETTPAGQPAALTWRGRRHPVRVLGEWDAWVYRIATTIDDQPAIGEIARYDDGWRLRRWWTY
jgi:hypothetical protein